MDHDHQKIGLPPLSLRQLHYALAAADAGNVTEAARRLNVSQPAISAAIAAIEAHYATPVFTRNPGQGISATRFGQNLFPEIRSLLKQARAVFDRGAAGDSLRGEVSIGIYEALAPYYLPALLARLETELPGVTVRYFETSLDDLLVRLHDGSADLAITYDVGIDSELDVTPLYALRPFILVPGADPLASTSGARLRDVHGRPLVLLDQNASAQYVLGLLHASRVKPSKIIRVKSFELQRSFVANGLGLAVSHTRPLVETSYDGKPLVAVPVRDRLAPQHVLMATARRHRVAAATAAVAETVVRIFAELPQAAVADGFLIKQIKRA